MNDQPNHDRTTPLSVATVEEIVQELQARDLTMVFAAQLLTGSKEGEEMFTFGGRGNVYTHCLGLLEAMKAHLLDEMMIDKYGEDIEEELGGDSQSSS